MGEGWGQVGLVQKREMVWWSGHLDVNVDYIEYYLLRLVNYGGIKGGLIEKV